MTTVNSTRVKDIETEKIIELELLVEELLKDFPAEPVVRSTMKSVGLDYSEDKIRCMHRVLAAMEIVRKKSKKDLHSV